ncbi:Acetyl esterase/lipase [Singulisphaera sp. GP187]|uniref:alpha/beta hydrolase n=1 Tax=Singulisphaera sp. GP187 TaxID=1882752 RepID=UPI000928B64F|nr:alpha/beta hydrolase [Singulisphaera sp. GP187]SIO61807.1 Acetyl esterase/lipase [Singulisphaera sp. GP187]
MRTTLGAFLALLVAATAVVAAEEPKTFPLWAEGAPGALGTEAGDPYHAGDIPTVTVYRPDRDKANGGSIVVCPGGGYGFLATDHEGKDVAEWARSLGLTAFVLKYRLAPRYHHPRMLEDAQRAIRTVRARASEWELDPNRVAIIGFSAGGHLASTAATHFDGGKANATDPIERQSSRPDLAILVYPVIAMGTPYGHTGSLKNLLGDSPSKALVESLSNETQVTKDTPPTFLAHTNEDNGVVPENSLLFALALRKAKVPVELHLFEKGQHGLGLGTGWADKIPPNEAFQAWPKLCATWLKGRGFLTPSPSATAK